MFLLGVNNGLKGSDPMLQVGALYFSPCAPALTSGRGPTVIQVSLEMEVIQNSFLSI